MVTCVIIIIMFFVNHISPSSAPYSNPVGGGKALSVGLPPAS